MRNEPSRYTFEKRLNDVQGGELSSICWMVFWICDQIGALKGGISRIEVQRNIDI